MNTASSSEPSEAGGNDVVFGTRVFKKLLLKFPRTSKYFELMQEELEAHTKSAMKKRASIVENIVKEAYGWDPPARFFKYNRSTGKIYPLTEKDANDETRSGFLYLRKLQRNREAKIRSREVTKNASNAPESERNTDIISLEKTSDSRCAEDDDEKVAADGASLEGDDSSTSDSSDMGQSADETCDNANGDRTVDTAGGPLQSEAPRVKKRSFVEESASVIDSVEHEMKGWDPSSIRFKLRKKHLARTTVVNL